MGLLLDDTSAPRQATAVRLSLPLDSFVVLVSLKRCVLVLDVSFISDCLVPYMCCPQEANSSAFSQLDLTRCGVLVGSGMGGLSVFQDGVKNLVEKGYKKISPFFIPYAITNMGGALLAIDTGFMGPNYSISTACATANYAFVSAANHIRQGEADLMVVGGSEAPIIPVGLGGFVACRALSQRNDEPQAASR